MGPFTNTYFQSGVNSRLLSMLRSYYELHCFPSTTSSPECVCALEESVPQHTDTLHDKSLEDHDWL